jgi:hypothetical protein
VCDERQRHHPRDRVVSRVRQGQPVWPTPHGTPRCGACHQPLKIVKVNIDAAPTVAARFGAYSIPLLVLTRDGREIARHVGAATQRQINAWLDSQLTTIGAA